MKYLKNSLYFLPVATFFLISLTFFLALKYNNSDELPSNLIKKIAPELTLSQLGKKNLPTNEDLLSPQIKLVNFWASWCPPCRAEHPMLQKINELNFSIIGVNYKDNAANALVFLDALGDPYSKVGADFSGRNGLEWGLYGVPETFVIDKNGKIILRHAGPITSATYEKLFKPLLIQTR